MGVPFSNMEDIIYCHNEELAVKLFNYLMSEGYAVGMSGSQINTGTHGEQYVKRLDVYKKERKGEFAMRKIVILANNMIDEEEREIFQAEIPYDAESGFIVNEDGLEVSLDKIWVDFEVKFIEI